MRSPARGRATWAVVGVTAIWGVTFPLNERALGSLGPVELTFGRFSVAALVLWVLALARGHRIDRRSVVAGVTSGLALFGGYLTQIEGQRFVSPTIAGFLTGLSVVVVPIFVMALGRRPSGRQLFGIVLAALALVVLSAPRGHASLVGIGLELACAGFFGAQIVVLEELGSPGDAMVTAALQMTTIAAATVVAAPLVGAGLVPTHVTPIAVTAVVYDGVLASALAFVVQAWALAHADSVEISVIYAAEPLFAALASLAFGYASLGLAVVVGGLLALAAMVLASVPPAAARSSDPTG